MKAKTKLYKLLSMLLCCVMLVGLLPTTAFADTTVIDGITVIYGSVKLELSGYEIGKKATDITLTSTQEGIILQQPTVYVGGSTTPYTGVFEPDVQYVLVLEEPTTESGYQLYNPTYHILMTVNGEKETIEEFQNTETIHKFKMPKLYTDYGITINGLKVTSENKDFIYARKDGKTITNNPGTVTYDPGTKTLRIKSVLKDPDTDKNQTIIFGNGKVNIVIEPMNDTYEGYVSGKLTIRDANNVSIYCKKGKFAAIYGNADIRKVNDVEIICDDGMLTQGSLGIIDANDVFLSCKSDVGEPVLGMSGFRCNTLTVENKAHFSKFCQEFFTFDKPADKLDEKYIYEVKNKETGVYEVKEVLTDYILEFNYLGIPRDDCFRIRPEAESETINSIYFQSNGGTGNMESVLCMSDTYTLPENKFTPPEGKEFKGWSTSSTGDVFSGTSISMSDVPGSIELYAIWQDKSDVDKYNITVTEGKATVGGAEITKAEEGTTVTLTANAAPADKVFDKWEVVSGDITLADASSATTTFTMPAGAVSVKATYKDKPVTTYNLTTQVNGGHGTISAGKTGLTAGSTETVIFTPDTGYEIDTVTVNGVETGVLSNVLNVTMDADKTVIVTYKEITHTHTPSGWKSDTDNHWKECTVVGCGVIIEGSKAAHTAGEWIIDTPATADTAGTKHKECTICGYVMETGTIPATGGSGSGSSGSSSGGGFSGVYNYPIVISDVENGKATADKNNAVAGDKVTITVTPDAGKAVDEVIVTDADGKTITVSKAGDNKYTFTMPAGKVNIAVTTRAVDYDLRVVMQINNRNILVNNSTITNDVAPVIVDNRTMVPIRVITETLGGTAHWNVDTRTVTLNIDGKTLTMTIGQTISGFDTAPIILNDRTYVPVRYVAEKLGASVEWVGEAQQIIITK